MQARSVGQRVIDIKVTTERFTNGARHRAPETPMPRWMLVFPVALLLLAIVIVFAFNSTGPTRTQDTHVTESGGGGSAGPKP